MPDASIDTSLLDLLYTETRDRVIRQLEDNRALSTKASIAIGFDGAALAGAMALLPNLSALTTATASLPVPVLALAFVGAGLLLVLASLALAIAAYWCREYRGTLDPGAAYKEFQTSSEQEAKVQLLHAMIDAHEQNQKQIKTKATLVKWSLLTLGLGVFSFTLLSLHILAAFVLQP